MGRGSGAFLNIACHMLPVSGSAAERRAAEPEGAADSRRSEVGRSGGREVRRSAPRSLYGDELRRRLQRLLVLRGF